MNQMFRGTFPLGLPEGGWVFGGLWANVSRPSVFQRAARTGLLLFLGDRTDCLFCLFLLLLACFWADSKSRFVSAVVVNGVFLAMTLSAVTGMP